MGKARRDSSTPIHWGFCEPQWVELGNGSGVKRGTHVGLAAARGSEDKRRGVEESRAGGGGGKRLVKGEEIGERIIEMMGDKKLRVTARKVGEEA